MKNILFFLLTLFAVTFFSASILHSQSIEKQLADAISADDIVKVTEILKTNKDLLNKEISSYGYPLFWAIKKKRFDIAEKLLELGASASVKSEDGMNAIHHLAQMGNPSEKEFEKLVNFLRLLKSKGCDINAYTKTGYTPLHYLINAGFASKTDPVRIKFIEKFIEEGANPKLDSKTQDKKPLLLEIISDMKAGEKGKDGSVSIVGAVSFEYMKILIQKGYDPNVTDADKNTALIIIAKKKIPDDKKEEMIKFLIENKANPKLKNKEKKTAADYLEKNSPLLSLLK